MSGRKDDAIDDLTTPLASAPRTGYFGVSAPRVLQKQRNAAVAAPAPPGEPMHNKAMRILEHSREVNAALI